MTHHILVVAVAAFLAGTVVAGCDTTLEQQRDNAKAKAGDATRTLEGARAEYLAEWETFKRESERTIAANEKKIAAFKEKMERAGSKVNAKYSKEVAELDQKNRDLKRKLEAYTDEGQRKWEEFKTSFTHDMDGLGKTIEDVFTRGD